MANSQLPNRDVVIFNSDDVSVEGMINILFEDLGAIELANIVRRDTVDGQNPYYSLISNLSATKKDFDPTTIISRQKPNQSYFDIYAIDLNQRIPDSIYLSVNNIDNFYYIDSNGDFVIELDNMLVDEEIFVEIANGGTIKLVRDI